MRPLRILFVAPYVPSLTRVRPFNLIKQLAGRGHRVTLCAASTEGSRDDAVQALRPYCEMIEVVPVARAQAWLNCLRALPTDVPLQAVYGYSRALRARIETMADRSNQDAFDVVHIEHLRAALLAWAVEAPCVFDAVDCISQLFDLTASMGPHRVSRWAAQLDLSRTRRFERRLLGRFERTVAVSPEERAALLALCDGDGDGVGQRIAVVPNGVDLDYFQPMPVAREPATLVFVGRMSYHANVAAIDFLVGDVLPRVWERYPDVRLNIVGEDPIPRLHQLANASGGRVTLTGTVADIRPHVAAAAIAVCPVTYGVGIQNKVLEAMAMGMPVICTPIAIRPLNARDGEQLLVAADATIFAQHIGTLLHDARLRARLGAGARQYVERHHDWSTSAECLETIYREEIERHDER